MIIIVTYTNNNVIGDWRGVGVKGIRPMMIQFFCSVQVTSSLSLPSLSN